MIKEKKYNEIFVLLVSILPFLYQYKSPISVVSFGEFILIPFIMYYFIKRFKVKLPFGTCNGIFMYFFIGIFCTLFASYESHFKFNDFMTVGARIIYYSALIYVCYFEYDCNLGCKIIKKISIFFIIYAIIQYITHLFSGIVLPTTINPNWVFAPEAGSRLDYERYYRWLYRSSSLFLEPGYFVSYCTPAFIGIFFLENKKDRKNIALMVLFTIGFLVSTSSAGLVILLIGWGGFIIKYLFSNKTNRSSKVCIVTIAILFVLAMLSSPMASTILNRTKGGGSFNNRITRTILLIKEMNVYQMIFGVGINNVENFVVDNEISTEYDEIGNLGYTSAFFGTIVNTGIITFIFYNLFFITTFLKNKDWYTRMLIIIFLFFNIIGNVTYKASFAYYSILLLSRQKLNGEKKNYKKDELIKNDINNLCM